MYNMTLQTLVILVIYRRHSVSQVNLLMNMANVRLSGRFQGSEVWFLSHLWQDKKLFCFQPQKLPSFILLSCYCCFLQVLQVQNKQSKKLLAIKVIIWAVLMSRQKTNVLPNRSWREDERMPRGQMSGCAL